MSIKKEYERLLKQGLGGPHRLTIKVNDKGRDSVYLDIGVRRYDDPKNILSTEVEEESTTQGYYMQGDNYGDNYEVWVPQHQVKMRPRFLEDFMMEYDEIEVLEYGKHLKHKEEIDTILSINTK